MKAYTDIEQSKKLAEILPLESADMIWVLANPDLPMIRAIAYEDSEKSKYYEILPAWSLAALLNYLREIDFFPEIEADEHGVTMSINYYDEEEARLLAPVHNIKVKTESFIDACVEMIIKLHEQKLL